jgi:hypothetical protein
MGLGTALRCSVLHSHDKRLQFSLSYLGECGTIEDFELSQKPPAAERVCVSYDNNTWSCRARFPDKYNRCTKNVSRAISTLDRPAAQWRGNVIHCTLFRASIHAFAFPPVPIIILLVGRTCEYISSSSGSMNVCARIYYKCRTTTAGCR